MNETSVGLCADCRYKRMVENRRGSIFLMCERSKTDDAFAKYPPLPVMACDGYEGEVEEE